MTEIKPILVSIVILTFNQEKLIAECLDSVKQQTYSNIELIISDDASTDNTVNIIEEWILKYRNYFSRVLFIKNKINIGISGNHTLAVSKAKGKYIKYLGGDDLLNSQAIERMVGYVEENHYDWIVCRIAIFRDSFSNNQPQKLSALASWAFKRNWEKQLYAMFAGNFISAPGVFIRRKLLEEVGYFGDFYKTREDYHTWLSIIANGHSVNYFAEILVYWRRHKDSVSSSLFQKSNARWFLESIHTIEFQIIPMIPKWALLMKLHVWLVKRNYMKIISRGVKFSKWDRLYSYIDPIFWILKFLNFIFST